MVSLKHIALPALIYFFTTITVYSVNDFTFLIIKEIFGNNSRKSFALLFLNVFRIAAYFVNTFLLNYISMGLILAYNTFIFTISLSLQLYLINNTDTHWTVKILAVSLYYFGCGGIYCILDSLVTTMLFKRNLMEKYSLVKLFAPLGHISSYAPGYLSKVKGHRVKLMYGITAGIVSVIYNLIFIRNVQIEKVKPIQMEKNQKVSYVNNFNRSFLILLIVILCQGLIKAVFSTVQRDFFVTLVYSEAKGNSIHILRLVVEIILLSVMGFKSINIDFLLLLSLVVSLLRPFFYILIVHVDRIKYPRAVDFLTYTSELSKCTMGAMFGYSIVSKISTIVPQEFNAKAQSLFNMFYMGLSLLLTSFLGYFTFSDNLEDKSLDPYLFLFKITLVSGFISIGLYLVLLIRSKKSNYVI